MLSASLPRSGDPFATLPIASRDHDARASRSVRSSPVRRALLALVLSGAGVFAADASTAADAMTAADASTAATARPAQAAGDPPPPAAARAIPGPELAEILASTVTVRFQGASFREVSQDLYQQVGLHLACPWSIEDDQAFAWTFQAERMTVGDLLARLEQAGGLVLEYHGDTAVFWRNADAATLATLERTLQTGGAAERIAALATLAHLGDPRALTLLSRAIADRDEPVAIAALKYFRWFQPESHVHWSERCSSIAWYWRHPDLPRASPDVAVVESLLAFLGNADWSVRRDAAFAAGRMRDPRVVPALITVPWGGRAEVLLEAALSLGLLGDPRALEPLLAMLESGPLPDTVNRVAARALGLLGDPRALEPLVDLLEDQQVAPDVRYTAAVALGELRDPRALAPLLASLQAAVSLHGQDADARRARRKQLKGAITGLKWLGDPRALDPLLALLKNDQIMKDPSDFLIDVADALQVLHDPRLPDRLRVLLQDPDPTVRKRVLACIDSPRNAPGIAPLLALLQDPDPEVRKLAVVGLGCLRDPRTWEPLVALLKDDDKSVRMAAANAVTRLGDPRTLALDLGEERACTEPSAPPKPGPLEGAADF